MTQTTIDPNLTPRFTAVCDWDGCAVPNAWPERPTEFNPGFVTNMRRLHAAGWKIVIFSARLSPWDPWTSTRRDRAVVFAETQYIRDMLDRHGLTFVDIWTKEGKPGGDIYYDDRAERYGGRPGSWDRLVDKTLIRFGDAAATFPAFDQTVSDNQPTPEDLAWAAGFFDGEGSVMICIAPNRTYLRALIAQKDRRPLRQLQQWFGGALSKTLSRPSGVSYLTLSTRQAATFLAAVRPYLRVKHAQVDVALEFQALRGSPVDRERDLGLAARLKAVRQVDGHAQLLEEAAELAASA